MIKQFDSDAVSIITNIARLSRRQQDIILGRHTSWHINEIYKEDEYSEAMRILYQLIRQEKPYFEERIDPRDFYKVFAVVPQQLSERVRAQSGAFLMSAFHERLERDEILRWNETIPVYAHYRLTISGQYRTSIMDDLRLLDITWENLFPGLDTAATSVSEYYRKLLEFTREKAREGT